MAKVGDFAGDDGDMTVSQGLLQLEAFGPGQSDEIEVTGTIAIGAAATIEIQLGYTPTTPLTFLAAGPGIDLDSGFAGPTVVGHLGTEAQGLNGATIQVVIGDQTFAAPVHVPPIDPAIDYGGDGVPDGIDACPNGLISRNQRGAIQACAAK